MKDKLITAIQMRMAPLLDTAQQAELQRVLAYYFHDVDVIERQASDQQEKEGLLDMFIAAKGVEGCSEKSLKYYDSTIRQMQNSVKKPVREITTDDLRVYQGFRIIKH